VSGSAELALTVAVERLCGLVEDLRDRLDVLGRSSAHGPVDLLTAEDVAHALGISPRTLRRERQRRGFPKPVRGRGRPRWRRREIEAYLERAR
jgi:predicted DNA-binding transcriptional regulator AlpA